MNPLENDSHFQYGSQVIPVTLYALIDNKLRRGQARRTDNSSWLNQSTELGRIRRRAHKHRARTLSLTK